MASQKKINTGTELTVIDGANGMALTPVQLLQQMRLESIDLDLQQIEATQELIEDTKQFNQVSEQLEATKEILQLQLQNEQKRSTIESVKQQGEQVKQATQKTMLNLAKLKKYVQP